MLAFVRPKRRWKLEVKVILTVVKQIKLLQRKLKKKSEASPGFEPMISAVEIAAYLCCRDATSLVSGEGVQCGICISVTVVALVHIVSRWFCVGQTYWTPDSKPLEVIYNTTIFF